MWMLMFAPSLFLAYLVVIFLATWGLGVWAFLQKMMFEGQVLIVSLNLFPAYSGLSAHFIFEIKSLMFSFLVMCIFSSVTLFSHFYMNQEVHFKRFSGLLCIFGASMLVFIHSASVPLMLLGWDGLGISSFLLIVFFQGMTPFKSGLVTVLTNRIGDCLILLACWAYFYNPEVLYWSSGSAAKVKIWYFFMALSGMTKSAQLPFSSWLPAAMAAPTPVSALVHSSTLVTAGLYLVWRVVEICPFFNIFRFLLLTGLCTAIFASISAFSESDLKKVVALSTLSQIGVMFIMLGLQMFDFMFYHLSVHAFLKALLFLVVGNMIHNSSDYQHVAKANLQAQSNKISLAAGISANLSLSGVAFMGAFYSKDLFLEKALSQSISGGISLGLVLTISLTAAYSFRLLSAMFCPQFNSSPCLEVQENSFQFFSAVLILYLAMLFLSMTLADWNLVKFFMFLPASTKMIFFIILGAASNFYRKTGHSNFMSLSKKNLWGLNEFLIKKTWNSILNCSHNIKKYTDHSESFFTSLLLSKQKKTYFLPQFFLVASIMGLVMF